MDMLGLYICKRLETFVIIVIIIPTIIAYQSLMFNSVCFMGLEVGLIFDFEKEFVIPPIVMGDILITF